MAQLLFLCLILANVQEGLALANEKARYHQSMDHSNSEPFYNPPALSRSKAETSMIRKLARHQIEVTKSSDHSPAPSPTKENGQPLQEHGLEGVTEYSVGVQDQNVHLRSRHHHSIDKSVAGGGVILGGLATTFLVAVFCYIRATGRHKNETSSRTSSVPGSPTNA